MPDPLDAVVKDQQPGKRRLRRQDLTELGESVSRADHEEFIGAAVRAPALHRDDGRPVDPNYFELHDGSWWLDPAEPGNREHLLAVVTAAVLVDALNLPQGLEWVSQVLAPALTLRSIRRDGTGLHLVLERNGEPTLPPHLVDVVNALDFGDFVAAVRAAGAQVPVPVGGTIVFVDPGR